MIFILILQNLAMKMKNTLVEIIYIKSELMLFILKL